MILLIAIILLVWAIVDLVTGRTNIAPSLQPKVYFKVEDGSLYYLAVAFKLLGAGYMFYRHFAR